MNKYMNLTLLLVTILLGAAIIQASGANKVTLKAKYVGTALLDISYVRDAKILVDKVDKGYADLLIMGYKKQPALDELRFIVARVSFSNNTIKEVAKKALPLIKGTTLVSPLIPGDLLGLSNKTFVIVTTWQNSTSTKITISSLEKETLKLQTISNIRLSRSTKIVRVYPGNEKGLLLILYMNFTKYTASTSWIGEYRLLSYNITDRKVIRDSPLPLVVERNGAAYTLLTKEPTAKHYTMRYFANIIVCNNSSQVAFIVLYTTSSAVKYETWLVDYKSGEIKGHREFSKRDYDLFLSDTEVAPNKTSHTMAILFLRIGDGGVVELLGCKNGELLQQLAGKARFTYNRVYLKLFNNQPLLFVQDTHSIMKLVTISGDSFSLFRLGGRYYVRITGHNYNGTSGYAIALVVPSSTKHPINVFFVLIKFSSAKKTETTETKTSTTQTTRTTTTTKTTTTTHTVTQTITATTTTPTKTMSPATTTSHTQTTTTTKTTTKITQTTKETKTTKTVAKTTTRSTTGKQTATSPPSPTEYPVKEGDWIKYTISVHGKGPRGSMSFKAEAKVTIDEVAQHYIRVKITPLTKLGTDQRALLMMALVNDNKLALALSANKEITVTYHLPLGKPGKSCPFLAEPRDTPYTVTYSGKIMGHEYSVKCYYTSKGILSKMEFTDTYSAAGQQLRVSIKASLTDSSTDVGAKAGSRSGLTLSSQPLILVAIVAIILAAIIVLLLKRR